MIAINRLILIAMITTAVVISGCASINSSKPLTVPGVDTGGVHLLENDDGKTAVLVGSVSRIIDRTAIEDFVRTEFNFSKIVNHITTE